MIACWNVIATGCMWYVSHLLCHRLLSKRYACAYITANSVWIPLHRVRSRVLLVPFGLPSVGPQTTGEFEAFEAFEEALLHSHYSSAVGWVICLKELLLTDGRQKVHEIKEQLRPIFGAKIRSTVGWAVCLFFVSHVSPLLWHTHACIINSLPHGDQVPQLANNYMTQLKDILVWLRKHCSWSV